MTWMCCAVTQHQNCPVLVASVDNSNKATCSLGRQLQRLYGDCGPEVAVINSFVFYSQNFCLFKLIFFCLSLLAAIVSPCLSMFCLAWVYSVHILTVLLTM